MPAKWRLTAQIAAMGLNAPTAPTICISPYYKTGRAPVQANWSLLFNSWSL